MKKTGKYVKRIISITILAVVLLVGGHLLGYALTPPNFNMHIANDLKKIESDDGRIDLMFVGASRVYHSFVPSIFEEKLGIKHAFNFGAANSPYSAAYYQLKNMAERYHPSRVVLGVTLDELIDQEWLRGKMVVWDRLDVKGKLEFFFGGLGMKNWKYAINAYRFRDELSNISYNLKEREKLKATDYAPETENPYYYGGNGFVRGKTGFLKGTIAIDGAREFGREKINSSALGYLEKCVSFCGEKGIELILVTAPTSMMRLYNTENYQEAIDYYNEFAASHNLRYYNLNLLKDRENILTDEMMYDYNHVNGEGAETVSSILADILIKEEAGEDTSSYFYADFDELKKSVKRVVATGCSKITTKEDGVHLEILSLHNENERIENQIEIIYEGETTPEVLVEWTEESSAVVSVPGRTDPTEIYEDVPESEQVTAEMAAEANASNSFKLFIKSRIKGKEDSEAVRTYTNWEVWAGYDIESAKAAEAKAANEILY